jgi:hypothetical protein
VGAGRCVMEMWPGGIGEGGGKAKSCVRLARSPSGTRSRRGTKVRSGGIDTQPCTRPRRASAANRAHPSGEDSTTSRDFPKNALLPLSKIRMHARAPRTRSGLAAPLTQGQAWGVPDAQKVGRVGLGRLQSERAKEGGAKSARGNSGDAPPPPIFRARCSSTCGPLCKHGDSIPKSSSHKQSIPSPFASNKNGVVQWWRGVSVQSSSLSSDCAARIERETDRSRPAAAPLTRF